MGKQILSVSLSLGAILLLGAFFLVSSPSGFPINKIITVEKGATLKEIADDFEKDGLIRYAVIFDSFIRYSGGEKSIKAGKYMFARSLSMFELRRKLINGDYGIPTIKVTIPEGSTIKDINKIFKGNDFSDVEIRDAALEGYLFPDTYFFSLDVASKEIIAKMNKNLMQKISGDLEDGIKKSGRSFHQILTMASLLEKEAADFENRSIISGILWKRLDIKMPLQVDAVFLYILGKNTFELTSDDLKIDSLYNTYRYKNLPPTPIANPGLDAIKAAIFPKKSSYLYYLSDKSNNIYYSETFDEHKAKKNKYLR